MSAPVVLHVAPHPDDEVIGAPATLMGLRDAGWRVVNLACSLGAPADRRRRLAELEESCRRVGFESEVVNGPLGDPLDTSDVADALRHLEVELAAALGRHRPRLVVAPSPHDRHRGHEVVGRAVVSVCADVMGAREPAPGQAPERLWLWGLWADLPFPSLAMAFDEARMTEVIEALSAHVGEIARNDYRRLVRGRAEMNASVGPERVFGFGTSGAGARYAELLTELGVEGGHWRLGAPRWLDPLAPTADLSELVLDVWLVGPSLTDRFGPPG